MVTVVRTSDYKALKSGPKVILQHNKPAIHLEWNAENCENVEHTPSREGVLGRSVPDAAGN
jgi:hypothetical protein